MESYGRAPQAAEVATHAINNPLGKLTTPAVSSR